MFCVLSFERNMEAVKKYFEKLTQYKCKVCITVQDDATDVERTCDKIIVVGKDSLWNLKRHISRNH